MSTHGKPRGLRGFRNAGGASFCHVCGKQLQMKAGGGFHFKILLTPGDRLPVRVHSKWCRENGLKDGYALPTKERS